MVLLSIPLIQTIQPTKIRLRKSLIQQKLHVLLKKKWNQNVIIWKIYQATNWSYLRDAWKSDHQKWRNFQNNQKQFSSTAENVELQMKLMSNRQKSAFQNSILLKVCKHKLTSFCFCRLWEVWIFSFKTFLGILTSVTDWVPFLHLFVFLNVKSRPESRRAPA